MISFCCPSRGRPELAKRLVDTATETQSGDTEFLFYLNDDDPTLGQYKDLLDAKHYTVGPNQSTCYSWNLMAQKSKHDIIMLMGDDVQVKTKDWDGIISNEFNRFQDKILMVVPSDGRMKGTRRLKQEEPTMWPDKNLPAAHFAIHRNWFNTVGYLAPPFFWHWHVDSYTQKVARKINRCLYLPTVEFKAKKVFDDTGKQVRTNMNINNRDNFVWQKVRNRHLEADVKVLKDFIKDQQTQ
jgi:hypothetical protein|tara:strand:+ start:2623 stop:3342 length:720 start_codon:yes stop_codon:yes gene_type:complete